VVGVEQLKTCLLDLLRSGVLLEQPLLDHLAHTQLGRALSLKEAAADCQGAVFTGLGVLHFVEQHRCDQHGVDVLASTVAKNQGAQLLQPGERVVAQGLNLIQALGEELGDGWLGSMHSKAAIQLTQFLGSEIHWIRTLTLQRGGLTGRFRARAKGGYNRWRMHQRDPGRQCQNSAR
jgi:hypothetical protein